MNCSVKAGSARIAIGCRPAACSVLLMGWGAFASVAIHAQSMAELDDAASRAQYAYLTQDARALEDALNEVAQSSFESNVAPLKSYQLAYGHWKLAQLNAQLLAQRGAQARAAVAKAAKACVEHAKATVKLDSQFAEAYAVQAICEDKPHAGPTHQEVSEAACDRNRALRTALSLAPKNPRVKFVAALCARPTHVDAQVLRWRDVVETFDAAPKPRSAVVDWGHAEALTALAYALSSAEQTVAARDAVERALVIAPDYDAAQSVLKSLAETR